jgi:putative tryptophan/tyrosine transport system substrate-binding protein
MSVRGMKRRDFIAALGGVAAWPIATRAQQASMRVIGYLDSGSPEASVEVVAAVLTGLSEAGYVDGRNVDVDYQWARGQYDRLPTLVAHLLDRPVALIVTRGFPSTLAAKSATSTVPIVFVTGGDPVDFKLVSSLNRPGSNVTGVNMALGALGPKRLELLRELVPTAATVAILVNPNNPITEVHLALEQAAAREIGQHVIVANAGIAADLDGAFAMFLQRKAGALIVNDDPFFVSSRELLVALAARHALPAIYFSTMFAVSGGLMSYGPNIADTYRQAGIYAGRILKGAKPADLPVVQPTRFQLVINLKTAKALGITVPPSLLARADEVIE